MIEAHLRKNREKFLPEVSDWTAPYDEFRFEKNVNKLKQHEWFWFHPTSYAMFYFAPSLITSILFSLGALYSILNDYGMAATFCLFVSFLMVYDFLKKYKKRDQIKNLTMYDFYLRDYIVGEKA